MKKRICLLLALIMVLGLWACSSTNARHENVMKLLEQGDYDGAIAAIQQIKLENGGGLVLDGVIGVIQGGIQELTQEEQALINQYAGIYRFLHDIDKDVFYKDSWLSGQEALHYCYVTLPQLEGVEKWAGTEYVESYDDVEIWDPQALLTGFTVLEDVPQRVTRTLVDNLNNVSETTLTIWHYNSDGSVKSTSGEEMIKPFDYSGWRSAYDSFYYTYDENGRLTQKTQGKNPVSAVYTYTYDAAGRIVKEHCKTNTEEQEYAYAYDSAGRLSQISWQTEDQRYAIDYTYDAAGRLVRETKTTFWNLSWADDPIWDNDYKIIMDYVYDESGRLVSGSLAKQDWQVGEYRYATALYSESIDQYTYTYNEQGHLDKVQIIPGNKIAKYYDPGTVLDTPDYVSQTWEYSYGYYTYTPVQ